MIGNKKLAIPRYEIIVPLEFLLHKKKFQSMENKSEVLYLSQPWIGRDFSCDEWLNDL